jgi:hypothetical protein
MDAAGKSHADRTYKGPAVASVALQRFKKNLGDSAADGTWGWEFNSV